MDIRNFFGGGAKPKVSKKAVSDEVKEEVENEKNGNKNASRESEDSMPKKKVKRVIEDDDEEEELEFGESATKKTAELTETEDSSRTETGKPRIKECKVEKNMPESPKDEPAVEKRAQQASIFSIAKKSSETTGKKSKPEITSTTVSTTPSDTSTDLADFITWKPLTPVPYAIVASAFDKVGATSSRLEKESILTKLYRAVAITTPDDLEHVVYLTSNTVYPAYAGMELGIGDALLVKAVVEATGRNRNAVQAAYKEHGDLGIVACQSRQNQSMLSFGAKPKPLTARFVLEQLRLITNTSGGKSMDKKVGIIKKMMVACQGDEAKYIVRALQGKLRIGIAMQTVLVGLAHAFATPTTHQIALSTSLDDSHEESKMDVVASEDEDVSEKDDVTVQDQLKREENLDEVIKQRYVLTEDEKLDALSLTGNEKLNKWVSDLSYYPPEESVKLRNAEKEAHTGRYHKLSKEERDELAVIAVKRAFSECPGLELVTNALLKYPIYDIHKYCLLTPGVPVAPMLAKPTKQIAEVLKRLNGLSFTMEYKYDGERAQVHLLEDGSVKIFSRNSEDNSQV